jgi:hypothetical protein
MAIITNLTYSQALNLSEPTHIRLTNTQVIVYTGSDIPPQPRLISPYDFRQRFTSDEMTAILNAAYSGDTTVRKLLLKLQTTDSIDLDNSEVIGGCQYLVSQNVITEERKEVILG